MEIPRGGTASPELDFLFQFSPGSVGSGGAVSPARSHTSVTLQQPAAACGGEQQPVRGASALSQQEQRGKKKKIHSEMKPTNKVPSRSLNLTLHYKF